MNAPDSGIKKRMRCAVYTRKSTDEGLDQEYNSIDAQRDTATTFPREMPRKDTGHRA